MRSLGLIIITLILASCNFNSEQNQQARVIYHPAYATAFRIVEVQGDTLIEILKSGQVIQRESCKKKPQNLAVFSTTHIHYLSQLNLQNTLVATVYGSRVDDSVVRERIRNNQCVNWENAEVSKEQVAVSGAQGILSLPYEGRNWKSFFPEMPVLPMFEYEEQHPLGRAEWLVAVGFFMGKSKQSIEAFKQIENKYMSHKVEQASQPKVAVLAYSGSAWTIAPSQSFWSVLLANAGGTYLGCEGDKSQEYDTEQVIELLNQADVYLEVNYREGDTHFDLNDLNPKLSAYFQTNKKAVFGCNTAMNGFFGPALLEPDVLLLELKNQLSNSNSESKYFQKLNSAN
ncbi:MAG: hypothetical protein ACK5EW_05890 [Bacteroidota bacterium]